MSAFLEGNAIDGFKKAGSRELPAFLRFFGAKRKKVTQQKP
jgi:hypothetical protein